MGQRPDMTAVAAGTRMKSSRALAREGCVEGAARSKRGHQDPTRRPGAGRTIKLRFEREAKTISHLNHPHICTLYDVGDDYLVMELLEGETLADRLERGPLPLADVLKYGAQIAEALDRAHRGNVVHRDLKPGNVMITKAGAKLL